MAAQVSTPLPTRDAPARGKIPGQIVVVPYASPIGLGQYVNGDQLGHHDLASGRNFNRSWPDLFAPVAATIDEIVAATGWQPHTVRGAIAGALKKKLGLEVTSENVAGRGRIYRIMT